MFSNQQIKKLKRFALILSILFLGFTESKAQSTAIKSFTPDSMIFIKEMQTFLMNAREKEGKDFMKFFQPVFHSGVFSEKEKERIYKTCNMMLQKKLKPFPEFKNYLTTIVNFTESQQTEDSYNAWQRILEKIILNNKASVFSDFLETSEELFRFNVLYRSSTVIWASNNDNYMFDYDGNQPIIIFPSLNLRCFSKGDSSIIKNTKGIYYLNDHVFKGKGGRIDWERTGLSKDSVYADVAKYEIALKKSFFDIDSVTFYNKYYFEEPRLGKLEEKVLANITEENATYPRFQSYEITVAIENVYEGVDYLGGFYMKGADVIGSGNEEGDAQLIFYRENKPFLITKSKTFLIKADKVSSTRASVIIYLEEDSITHPGLLMRYIEKDKQLFLFREDKGIAKTPYTNTFHKINMDFEALYWKIDEPKMDMQYVKNSTQTKANFESVSFYNDVLFERMYSLGEYHPLMYLKDLATQKKAREFTVTEVAVFMRYPKTQIIPLLLQLSYLGFIKYNDDKETILIFDKVFDYITSRAKKTDYDVIEFKSEMKSSEPNATLNLLNFDLTMRGIETIFLSDSQNVYIRPAKEVITMKKNRDFFFGGSVHAGYFDYYGKEFSFDYDAFKINLIKVDSMAIRVTLGEKDQMGNEKMKRLKTVIEDIEGEILIDSPNNKSGVKDYTKFPIFKSFKESFVYYDRKSIQDAAYSRDKFYFKVYPYEIDSINSLTNEQVRFDGLFVSAGIFPDFEETLSLQPDFSLGFVRKTPPGGFPIYGGKAVYKNDINLSHKGLKGDGDIEYLTSISKSKDFTFLPEKIVATAQRFDNVEDGNPEVPLVEGIEVDFEYKPYQDILRVSKKENAIDLFRKKNAQAHNDVFLTPKGLSGAGRITFDEAIINSKAYTFKKMDIFSDTADFDLSTINSEEFAFKTTNINAHIDFVKRIGKFKSNKGASKVEFPVNQYVTYIDEFTWFMDKEEVDLTSSSGQSRPDPFNEGLDLKGSEFISIHPKQDSLSFLAPRAKYDLKQNIITATEVSYINVADAMIYPDSGKVIIYKKARMEILKNAKIVANYVTKYHKVYNATIEITGKRKYDGSGYYNYVDELNQETEIFFTRVYADTSGQTNGTGEIPDSLNFTLSPQFAYYGKILLRATNQFLTFDGYTKINHTCEIDKSWLRFGNEVDPKNVMIPITGKLVNETNNNVHLGLLFKNDSTGMHTAFISPTRAPKPDEIATSRGYLTYDKRAKEYRVAEKDKLNELNLPGNFISLNVDSCRFYGEGTLDLGVNLGNIKLKPYGNARQNLINNEMKMNLIMTLNFFFDEGILDKMADRIAESTSPGISYADPTYEKGLRDMIGKEEADKTISQLNLYGSLRRLPQSMRHTMFLTHVNFDWDHDTKSYVSKGNFGVASINKTQVNKMVKGHIRINRKRGGDIFDIFIETEGGKWYYFNYQKNLLQVISSEAEFNEAVKNLKNDKKKYKNEKGEPPFRYIISTESKKRNFIRSMETIENNEEE
jgi:hypothetical protein